MDTLYKKAATAILHSKYCVAFTGAGISVESGIPTFRGENGLWSRYDPKILDINFFVSNPKESWRYIKEIFYDYMQNTKPNDAHKFLAHLEEKYSLKGVITQNIDNLHQEAGSKNVIEFHGTASKLLCMQCKTKYNSKEISLDNLPPFCAKCGGLLKPDFVFFGEPIPNDAYMNSQELCKKADCLIIIGTTGEIMPASYIPYLAKKAEVIEINIEPSRYTDEITTIFLKEKATIAAKKIEFYLKE